MTKLKNTKKGMAKKALSISLVAAMLATSNVPVWAADMFSDGTDAVVNETDLFIADETEQTIEEIVDVPALQAEDSTYTAEFKDLPSEIQWATPTTIKIKVTDNTKNETTKMYVRYLENGVQSDIYDTDIALSGMTADENGYVNFPIAFDKTDVGHTFQLQVFEKVNGNVGWSQISPAFTATKQEISGTVDFSIASDESKAVRYTGKQANTVPTFEVKEIALPTGVDSADIKGVADYQITGVDTINAVDVSKAPVEATGDIVSDYYTGKVTVKYNIWRKVVDSAADAAKVELSKYNYQYTGGNITVPAKDITVTNKLTGDIIKDAASDFTIGSAVGSSANTVSVDMTKGTLANFCGPNDTVFGTEGVAPAQTVEITKRDLADTSNTKVSIKTVTQDLLQNSTIAAENLKNNLVIEDVATATDIASTLKGEISIDFGGKDSIAVEAGKTYTATVKAKTTNVINSCTVNFTVVAHDLGTASFEKEADFSAPVTYTGEKITKGLTKENLLTKLGALKVNGTPLSPNVDFDTDVQFGDNTDVGTGTIIINGKGSYEGSKKIISFTIDQRTADTLVVPEKVLYDAANTDGEDYALETSVTAKFTGDDKKEHVLTVPATDYKVTREIVDKDGKAAENKPENFVKTTVTLTNTKGNFTFSPSSLTKTTKIVNKAITDADVTMDKTSYTYTGAEVKPEYKVVVAGQTLEKGVDYDETVTRNINVGKAVLTITGKGDFDKTSVTKEFEIVPAKTVDVVVEVADASKATVVYNGKKHTPSASVLSITLNGNDVSKQFALSYPTSKTANINAGKGQVTLTPVKGNKNFDGVKDATFTIGTADLINGTLNVYDEKGTRLTISSQHFTYNGTAHTFAKEVYKNNTIAAPMALTSSDYEVIYKDHVVGDANGNGHILVIAKGNYSSTGTYKCVDGTVVENVVLNETFAIDKVSVAKKDITVNNGTYKGGFDVDPEVKVVVDGKTLVKDVDYELTYTAADAAKRKDVTNGKTLSVTVKGKGGYTIGSGNAGETFTWGIDKFDLANSDILVSGTDADPIVKVMNGSIMIDTAEYDLAVADGKVTVTAKAESKGYTGTKTADIKQELERPAAPVISSVEVVGNKATVVLAGESDGATGYDYVISKSNVFSDKASRVAVNANVLSTQTTFRYVDQDIYYAYLHSWKRGADGKKIFSAWSNAYPFSVSAITPDQPTVTSVKVSGKTVKVTYTKVANATGYDLVLGSKVKKVYGEKRPVEYGKLVKKVYNGNTVTATFTNVPKGTYYAGLHAYNRTSENRGKVFSPWSNTKKVVVR